MSPDVYIDKLRSSVRLSECRRVAYASTSAWQLTKRYSAQYPFHIRDSSFYILLTAASRSVTAIRLNLDMLHRPRPVFVKTFQTCRREYNSPLQNQCRPPGVDHRDSDLRAGTRRTMSIIAFVARGVYEWRHSGGLNRRERHLVSHCYGAS